MAQKNTVVTSINHDGAQRCVDVFRRPDGTFGFEEFRRDLEDHRGWFAIGFYGSRIFQSADDALSDARKEVPWLVDAMTRH